MFGVAGQRFSRAKRGLRAALTRVEVLALFPILVLLAFEFGGPQAVVAAAMILPTLLVFLNLGPTGEADAGAEPPHAALDEGEDGRQILRAMLDRVAAMPSTRGACLLLDLDDWEGVARLWGRETAIDVLGHVHRRLRAALRDTDRLVYLGAGRFGVVAHGLPSDGIGLRNTMADRLQACVTEPLRLGETTLRLTATLGHARLDREALDPAGAALDAAEHALTIAQSCGPGSMRAYCEGATPALMTGTSRGGAEPELAPEVPEALETGAIQPWFLPEIDARTDAVTGFEVLTRWNHPTRGILTPAHFAASIAEAGQIDAVAARIRDRAIDALAEWDRAGTSGLGITLRVEAQALRDPALAEQLAWALDAADVAPERLTLAIPEPVADSAGTDAVLTTLASLRQQGARLDLDDFGTGGASLLSIRRFGIARLRIDRSLVRGIDWDTEHQAMVGGILSLAREMRLGSLAQGVATPGERAALAEMGCDVLQGPAIGAPMPFGEARDWVNRRQPAHPKLVPDLPEHRPSA